MNPATATLTLVLATAFVGNSLTTFLFDHNLPKETWKCSETRVINDTETCSQYTWSGK